MATATSIPHAPTPPPGTSEWHAQRRLGIGGSEAAAMFKKATAAIAA
jgi:predicted phage-related endonuclease